MKKLLLILPFFLSGCLVSTSPALQQQVRSLEEREARQADEITRLQAQVKEEKNHAVTTQQTVDSSWRSVLDSCWDQIYNKGKEYGKR